MITDSPSYPWLHLAGFSTSKVYAVVVAIIGPGVPIIAWLLLTYHYRQDKLMIIRQVGKHVSEAELGVGAADSSIGSRQGVPSSRSMSSQGSGVLEGLSA